MNLKMKTLTETLGYFGGYLFGATFGLGSFIRRSKMFHAQGYVFKGKCESKLLHGPVVMRFSSALWKHKEWPDVLGMAIKFGEGKDTQDLLFVTTNRVWKLPINIFTSHFTDFSKNIFYSITPFEVNGKHLKFRAYCENHAEGENREERIRHLVNSGLASFIIEAKEQNEWEKVAHITLQKEILLDQQELSFSPFNQGQNLRPVGFVNFLRLRSYQMSQAGRKLRESHNILKIDEIKKSPKALSRNLFLFSKKS